MGKALAQGTTRPTVITLKEVSREANYTLICFMRNAHNWCERNPRFKQAVCMLQISHDAFATDKCKFYLMHVLAVEATLSIVYSKAIKLQF